MEMWAVLAIVVVAVLAAIGFVVVLQWLFEWRMCRTTHGVHVHRYECWQHKEVY